MALPPTLPTPADVILSIRGLRVGFDTGRGRLPAVNGVDLELRRGETLAIVGESGSGKSTLAMSLIGLNLGPRTHISGSAALNGRELIGLPEGELRRTRGKDIAVIFQDALAALNPLKKVGAQIVEMLREHQEIGRAEAWVRAEQLLADVGISRPRVNARAYANQYSGGMRQRAMIAMAMANNPAVLIADEPTTALDVTIQAQVLDLLQRQQREHGTSIILITHDLGVVADVADRVAVMYAGRIVEQGSCSDVLNNPQHPYTIGLLNSTPRIDGELLDRLPAIPGSPLSGIERPSGCSFAPRCYAAVQSCTEQTPELSQRDLHAHLSACLLNSSDVDASSPDVELSHTAGGIR